jgi:L,D-peptidoglycan transpeptidase YkuD (ErfK/YbiS/YcfS/YnhG family)
MDIQVRPPGTLMWRGRRVRCALGQGGLGADKREGDGATPEGCFPLRRVMYRADRVDRPLTALPVRTLRADDGWCDDPDDRRYNGLVRIPCAAGHEVLWRADEIYDVLVVLGFNDDPVIPGRGSAIFLHVARPDYAPTGGCVAVALPDLLSLLGDCDENARLCISRDSG